MRLIKPLMENGPGFKNLKNDWKCSGNSIFTAITAMVFVIAGAIPMLASVADSAKMQPREAASFVMCSLAIGCIISVIVSIYYRTPVFFAASLTAIVVLKPMFQQFSIPEMVGGFIVAGAAVFVIGYTGLIGWIGKYLPLPVVLGMVAGVFMSYGLDIVNSIVSDPVSGCIIAGSFVAFPLITKKIPSHIVALIAGVVCAVVIHDMTIGGGNVSAGLSYPVIVLPDFSRSVLLTVSLPLVIMALADIFKGYGVLKSNGYDIPLNTIAMLGGIGSIFAAFGLSHTISPAGPVMAILTGKDAGEKKSRFIGAVIFFCGVMVICVMCGMIMPIIMELPKKIIDLICGLAMTGLLTSSLQGAFGSGKCQMGALTAFIIGLAKLNLFGIGAPVWAIVFGLIVTVCMDRKQYI